MGTIPKREDTKPRGALMQKKRKKKGKTANSSKTRERNAREACRHVTSLLGGKQLCRLTQGASRNGAREEGNMFITEHD